METVVLIGLIVIAIVIGAIGMIVFSQLRAMGAQLKSIEARQISLEKQLKAAMERIEAWSHHRDRLALPTSLPANLAGLLGPQGRKSLLPMILMVAGRMIATYLNKRRAASARKQN